MRGHLGKSTASRLQVLLSARDLEAQLRVGNRMVGAMAIKRMGSAVAGYLSPMGAGLRCRTVKVLALGSMDVR